MEEPRILSFKSKGRFRKFAALSRCAPERVPSILEELLTVTKPLCTTINEPIRSMFTPDLLRYPLTPKTPGAPWSYACYIPACLACNC